MSARPFLDTNILVYAHDVTAGEKHKIAKRLVADLWPNGGGCLSIQVLQELYVTLVRKVQDMTPKTARVLVESYSHWRTHRPAGIDVVSAINVHREQQLSFWDAMIVQSASLSGCEKLYTEDLNDGEWILEVQVVNPFAAAG
ncbi:MAG: PIN domain-containing protein [Trueperaceae bacterium]